MSINPEHYDWVAFYEKLAQTQPNNFKVHIDWNSHIEQQVEWAKWMIENNLTPQTKRTFKESEKLSQEILKKIRNI